MTHNDVFSLDENLIYEFRFYNGRVERGILVGMDFIKNEFYLVKQGDLKSWREAPDRIKYQEKINIETITNWKPIKL